MNEQRDDIALMCSEQEAKYDLIQSEAKANRSYTLYTGRFGHQHPRSSTIVEGELRANSGTRLWTV